MKMRFTTFVGRGESARTRSTAPTQPDTRWRDSLRGTNFQRFLLGD